MKTISLICPAPGCGKEFDPGDRASPTAPPGSEAQILYCTVACKRRVGNQRYYAKHKVEVIERILKNQGEQK